MTEKNLLATISVTLFQGCCRPLPPSPGVSVPRRPRVALLPGRRASAHVSSPCCAAFASQAVTSSHSHASGGRRPPARPSVCSLDRLAASQQRTGAAPAAATVPAAREAPPRRAAPRFLLEEASPAAAQRTPPLPAPFAALGAGAPLPLATGRQAGRPAGGGAQTDGRAPLPPAAAAGAEDEGAGGRVGAGQPFGRRAR